VKIRDVDHDTHFVFPFDHSGRYFKKAREATWFGLVRGLVFRLRKKIRIQEVETGRVTHCHHEVRVEVQNV